MRKGIKREFSVARTPQPFGVAEKKNRRLIEVWQELFIKPRNKTPYELIRERTPLIDFMKPFGYPITILNTRDHLGKFDGKADEGFFVGYSVDSKAMRLFDVDSLTISMNYVPVVTGNQTNGIAGTRDNIVTCQAEKKKEPEQEYILILICITNPLISQDPEVNEEDAEEKPTEMDKSGASDKDGKDDQAPRKVKAEFEKLVKQLDTYVPMNFEATKESLKRFGEELQTKTAKELKFDDDGTQPTEEKVEEDKDDKPTKKTGKRRKQIARKGFHTHLDKDEYEDSDEANEKDDSTSGTKIPINPVPVATKSPGIANYKIIKQGRKGVYQIVRKNGTDMVYISFGAMLTDISRDDLTELYRIVMRKHGQQRIICWRYYDACRVHCLNLESVDIYMLIERKYPLSAEVCKAMLDKKTSGVTDKNGDEGEQTWWRCYALTQQMVISLPCLTDIRMVVQEQTALGKDFSNPLMADNLPKIVWLSTHHICYCQASRAKKVGKLCPKWEGPYEVTEALGNGAYKLRDRDGKQLPRTWNIHNRNKCYVHEM
ncbi:putative ribonuclease H-like domain-containing protein [Tanacetum coccineum]